MTDVNPLIDSTIELPLIKVDYNEELPKYLNDLYIQFLKDLTRPKYSAPLEYDELVLIFKRFYKRFGDGIDVYIKGTVQLNKIEMKDFSEGDSDKESTSKEIDTRRKYLELVEYKLTNAFYDKLFQKSTIGNNVNKFITSKISIIKKLEIDIAKLIDLENVDLKLSIWNDLSILFNSLQLLKTPLQKIDKLIEIHLKINHFLKNHLTVDINGDYFLPSLIYIILINTDNVDFYLNFLYIQNFRNESFLNEDSLYCLTNFEAALMFIQTLDLSIYTPIEPLTKVEEAIWKDNNSLILAEENGLLNTSANITTQNLNGNHSTVLSASSNFLSSAIDTSFKSVLNRLRSPTNELPLPTIHTGSTTTTVTSGENIEVEPFPDGNETVITNNTNPLKNLVGDVMKWTNSRTSTPINSGATIIGTATSTTGGTSTSGIRSRSNSNLSFKNRNRSTSHLTNVSDVPINLTKFKNKKFNELTINELHQLYNDYQILTSYLQQ